MLRPSAFAILRRTGMRGLYPGWMF